MPSAAHRPTGARREPRHTIHRRPVAVGGGGIYHGIRHPARPAIQRIPHVIIIVGLLIAFVLVVVLSRPDTRNCRWREDRSADHDGKRLYKCLSCGAEVFTNTAKPPLDCKVNPRNR